MSSRVNQVKVERLTDKYCFTYLMYKCSQLSIQIRDLIVRSVESNAK